MASSGKIQEAKVCSKASEGVAGPNGIEDSKNRVEYVEVKPELKQETLAKEDNASDDIDNDLEVKGEELEIESSDSEYSDTDVEKDSNPNQLTKKRNTKGCEQKEYQRLLVKSYNLVTIREEPIENVKTIFKTSFLEFEKLKYHQQIFEQIVENCGQIKLRDLQAQYINQLRKAANIEIFTCCLCDYQTINKTTLNCHFLVNHNGKKEHEVFKCCKCDYETTFPSHIMRHLTIHKISKGKHKNEKRKEKYPCTKCSYKGRSEEGLKRHMSMHKDKTKCDLCSFESQDQNILKAHKTTHKSGDKYQCYKCNYTNNNKLPLARHLLNIHQVTNEASKRSKICEICSKSFGSIHQLRVHYVTHKALSEMSQSEIYQCTECNHQTKYKANYKLHMLIHKAPEFICDMCGFASKHKHSYENHLITHKKLSEIDWFRCAICPYKCRTRSQIRHHMKKGIHSDKNLRHIRNRDRIREAEEKGETFVVKKKPKKVDLTEKTKKPELLKPKRIQKPKTNKSIDLDETFANFGCGTPSDGDHSKIKVPTGPNPGLYSVK